MEPQDAKPQDVDAPYVEPWLRGALPGVPLLVMPLFFSLAQVREDLRKHVGGLSDEQVWRKVGSNAPVGFHLRHIPGSIDRLLTYLENREINEQQLEYLKRESQPGASTAQLLEDLEAGLSRAQQRLLQVDLSDLQAPRYVGRRRLEVTFIGLLVHIAEHTQRHLGQAITTAKMV